MLRRTAMLLLAVVFSAAVGAGDDPPAEKPPAKDPIVYVLPSGKKYHLVDCQYVKDKESARTAMKRSEAKDKGYDPCKVCKPDINREEK